jgi:hypothetical protein
LDEPSEAGVHKGSDDSTNDRCSQIQPGIIEIAGRDHRAECPRRVERSARESSAHDDVEGQRHSDRQWRDAAGTARDRRGKDDRNQEKSLSGVMPSAST